MIDANGHPLAGTEPVAVDVRDATTLLVTIARSEKLLHADRLLTPKEAARALAIHPNKLWAITNQGEIRSVRIGRAVRYDPADLRDFLERQKVPSRSKGAA